MNRLIPLVAFLAISTGLAQSSLVSVFNPLNSLEPFKPSVSEVTLLRQTVLSNALRKGLHADINCGGEFDVRDYARGAFTRKGAKQKAFIYRYCSGGSTFFYSGLAILENNRVLLNAVFAGNPVFIKSLPDITRNGVQEVLLFDGMIRMGNENMTVTILDLAGGLLRNLGSYQVMEGNCTGINEPYRAEHRHIFARPGSCPTFFANIYAGGCSSKLPLVRRNMPIKPAEFGGLDGFEVSRF